jgi:cation:H+ antiporter
MGAGAGVSARDCLSSPLRSRAERSPRSAGFEAGKKRLPLRAAPELKAMLLWLQFAACAGIILVSGTYLSKYGDVIAEKTGLGRTWVGVVLIASVTSLPELATGISSVAVFELPDIAAGNVFGACMLNLLMLAVLDAIGGPAPISARVHEGHILTAGFGILMLGLATLAMLVGASLPSVGWIGANSLLSILIYFLAMRLIYVYEKKRIAAFVKKLADEVQYRHISRAKAYALFVANALLIIAAALYLPRLGEGIAETSGLGQTFVGSVFIALSTTLPELVVSVSAVRLGAADMAVGNLFGSTMFNLFVLAVDDVFYTAGPLLVHVSMTNLTSAVSAIVALSIAVIGLVYRPEKKGAFLAWDALAIAAVYVFAVVILFRS